MENLPIRMPYKSSDQNIQFNSKQFHDYKTYVSTSSLGIFVRKSPVFPQRNWKNKMINQHYS